MISVPLIMLEGCVEHARRTIAWQLAPPAASPALMTTMLTWLFLISLQLQDF